jgi:hypothetical protein
MRYSISVDLWYPNEGRSPQFTLESVYLQNVDDASKKRFGAKR